MAGDINTAKRFVKLAEKKTKLETELKKVKSDMATLEEQLITYFQRHALRNLGAGDRTVYLHRQIWAAMPDREAGNEALKRHGFGDLVEDRVMPQRLSAWVRELLVEAEQNEGAAPITSENLSEALPLPPELKEQIKITEKFSVRVRKA